MSRDPDKAFFGHPAGLSTLFFTEMWERFSWYGMRAFLGLFLAAPKELGGMGMFILKNGEQEASANAVAVVGMVGAAVYLLGLPGGWIADRFLGQRKAVMIGGLGIAVGNAILALPDTGDFFYVGLVTIALGTGFLKPNISSLVGQLYKEGDPRRDGGYTIYYMGINIGAAIAPLACGYLATDPDFRLWLASKDLDPNLCWRVAFGAAAVGMVGGLVQFILGQRRLGDIGIHPTIPTDENIVKRDRKVLAAVVVLIVGLLGLIVVFKPTNDTIANVMGIGLAIASVVLFYVLYTSARDDKERRGVIAMIALYVGAIAFFAIFEQAPGTLNNFAQNYVDRDLLGLEVPAPYYQFVNAGFIVLLAPVAAYLWVRLARVNKEPTSVNNFAIGMVILALSFVIMLPTLGTTQSNKTSGMYLVGLYFFYTLAELFISPVGLSSMSKLAPARLSGMVMGVWFFATSIGVYLAGRAGKVTEKWSFDRLWVLMLVSSLVVAAVLFAVAPKIRKIMGVDAKAHGPADKSEKAEPEPLPSARVHKDDKD